MNNPMDVVGSTNWKITLPTKVHSTPDEIKYPALATFVDAENFHLTGDGKGIVFRAHTDGITTSGSANPRSELREMNDKNVEAAWSSTSGTHSMQMVLCVTVLPQGKKPVVVTGQIHDSKDDISVFRVEGNSYGDNSGDKNLCSIWITDSDKTHGHLVTNAYKLGDIYRVGFNVSNGQIRYTFNGQQLDYVQNKKFSGGYFKVGCYNQSGGIVTKDANGVSDYAEVILYSVIVCHDGKCVGNTSTDVPVIPTNDDSLKKADVTAKINDWVKLMQDYSKTLQ